MNEHEQNTLKLEAELVDDGFIDEIFKLNFIIEW